MKVTRLATNSLFAMTSVVSAFSPTVRQRHAHTFQHITAARSSTGTGSRNSLTTTTPATTTTTTTTAAYYTTTTTTRLHANVLKLSDPESQLLQNIDVFIFDCDGVIWRVRYIRQLLWFGG